MMDDPTSLRRRHWLGLGLGLAASFAWPSFARPEGAPRAAKASANTGADVVRPTVQIRNGRDRGSGTIIASVAGETLILTASHVVHGATELKVEIHRHNLGFPSLGLTEGGGWPRLVAATVVASDPDSDVAVVRVQGMVAMRYVARLDPEAKEPAAGEVVTSVGIDRTLHLTRWQTTVKGSGLIDLGKGGGKRPFTITARSPEHGRSGGGLFRADGSVVGVCTGQLHVKQTPTTGVFVSVESIRRLVRDNDLVLSPRPEKTRR
jgi:S1-C subfamily serine protease